MQRFADLQVWQLGHALALQIYKVTQSYPHHELFGMRAQLRRAAVSVPTNIAEGSKRQGRADYARFLNTAEGSLAETLSLLFLSRDLGYLKRPTVESLEEVVNRLAGMLHRLRLSVEHRTGR